MKYLISLAQGASALSLGLVSTMTWSQCAADLNGNATVDNDDLLLLLADFGNACDVAAWDDATISEIHYNPSTAQGLDSEYEFVELMNPHPFAIDLSGWSLADGIDATFPSGTVVPAMGFLLTVNDTATYRTLLGPYVQLVPWSGSSSLHNSGETLRLIRPDGTEADVVTYSDTGEWTNEADGAGGSLEWKGPGWDNAQPQSWAGSNALGGSPGMENSTWAD